MPQFVKLRLTGFKSFVDPTELLIEPGTTAIVGPNGCGKSNLVEALRWVMGETSAKRMRGAGMDDVIFSGSASRPPRNLAEVTLAIDNRDRTAPAAFNDFDELDVVRRIERDKGSAYRINGREVRARDVQLLFADAASGAQSPAIVSQGRVGAIINAKPADRRALLEEAAGISGLHSRRHEAELRLRAAETNLERLDDVIATLESQLQGLKRQARQATRYRNIAEQLRRQEAVLLWLEHRAAEAARAQAGRTLEAAERQVAERTQQAAEAARAQAGAAEAVPPLREREASAAAALQRLLLERETLQREAEQTAAAQRQAEARRAQIDGDLERARRLDADAQEALARLEAERSALAAAAEGEGEARAAAEARAETLSVAVGERDEALSRLAQRLAADEAQRGALERREAELAQRLQRLRADLEKTAGEVATAEAQGQERARLQAAEAAVAAARDAAEHARQDAEAAEAAVAAARDDEAAAREALRGTESARDKLTAEIAALSRLLDRGEADAWPPVIDAVTVAPGFEAALGAALGEDLEAPAEDSAAVHWRSLPPLAEPPPLPAGCRPLSELVEGPPALARRLSQVGLAEGAAEAAGRQSALAPGQRLVTREGGLWRWDGYTVAAGAPTAAAQRLEQKNRLAELQGALDGAEQRAQAALAAFERAQAAGAAKAAAEREAREQMRAAFAALNAAQEQRSRLEKAVAAADSRLAALRESRARLESDLAEGGDAQQAIRAELAELPDLAAARAHLSDLRSELAELRSRLADAAAERQRLAREAQSRAERLLAIQRERQSWERRQAEAARHRDELAERRAEAQAEIDALAERPAALEARRAALAERIAEAEGGRKQAADALAEAERRQSESGRGLKAAEQALAQAREDRVRAEGGLEQAEQALAGLVARVRERLEASPEDLAALAQLAPDQEPPAHAEVQAKLERLARERESIGPVNLRAEAEAREVEERIAGLQHERADLVAAINRLRHGISSLNREGRERLLTAFEKVNGSFTELFVRLFGGGQAHLKLVESDDPLEAGLEIMASPPGKRLQVMSLLSGGEQALTALALLFAVFLTNPAPICVLDEVDAPLDDSNVDRFCSLVQELAHSLQTRFLLVTHHRLTMARVDRLFGVTMAERGVSELVSVDLEGAESMRESA